MFIAPEVNAAAILSQIKQLPALMLDSEGSPADLPPCPTRLSSASSHEAATYPGLVLACKVIGILEVEQKKKGKVERNDRIFAVPDRSPFEGDLKDVRHLPRRATEELEKFFQATDALEPKDLKFLGWRGPSRAREAIRKCAK